LRVTLDVFSGRPNPSWELSAQEASELARRITGLTPINQSPGEGGLGYRGLIISNPGKVAGFPPQMSIFNGIISISRNRHTTHYHDTNNVERWLIEQARKHGYADLLDQLIGNKDH
jgi:hypothetical protein